jgi:hypothetical protein
LGVGVGEQTALTKNFSTLSHYLNSLGIINSKTIAAMKKFMLLLLLSLMTGSTVFTQEDYEKEILYAVTKNDGTVYLGKILSDDGREILMETQTLGKIYIPKADIRSIKKVEEKDIKRGVYVGENIFTTRYQFTTNSFPIKKGENYAVLNLYGPEVHFSVADNLSVGVMATWIASPIALALKYTIPTKNEMLNFGVGSLIGSSGYLNQAQGFGGLHWGMATYGDRFNNVTASFGYGYFNPGDEGSDFLNPAGTYFATPNEWGQPTFNFPNGQYYGSGTFQAPVIGLSGMFAVGEKATFILDVMAVFASQKRFYQTVDYNGPDVWNSTQVNISSPIAYKAISNNLVIMPAMRFQRRDNRAVQFSLAGIIGSNKFRESGLYSLRPGELVTNRYSIPIPMVSWFFKF